MDEPRWEMDPAARQRIVDDEHIRIVALANLVFGWIHVAMAVFPLIYVGMGIVLLVVGAQGAKPGEIEPAIVGWLMIAFGLAFSALCVAFGALQLYAARCIRRLRGRNLCLVVAALTCLNIPYGTAIGVATLIVFDRRTIKDRFV